MSELERHKAVAHLASCAAPGRLDRLEDTIPNLVPKPLAVVDAYELLLQSYLFFGYPQAIEVMRVFAAACRKLGLTPGRNGDSPSLEEMRLRGEARCREIYHPNFEKLHANMLAMSPELAEWMLVEGYGKVLSRPVPAKLEREIASITFLACSQHPVQLFSHVRGARNLGGDARLLQQIFSEDIFSGNELALVNETIKDVFSE
ncbi:MAG: hypothetical protein ABIJ61_07770 [bacterium]